MVDTWKMLVFLFWVLLCPECDFVNRNQLVPLFGLCFFLLSFEPLKTCMWFDIWEALVLSFMCVFQKVNFILTHLNFILTHLIFPPF